MIKLLSYAFPLIAAIIAAYTSLYNIKLQKERQKGRKIQTMDKEGKIYWKWLFIPFLICLAGTVWVNKQSTANAAAVATATEMEKTDEILTAIHKANMDY